MNTPTKYAYTPGPWVDVDGVICPLDGDGEPNAQAWIADLRGTADAIPNARLIAAAPDLLAALRLALPVLVDQHAALAPAIHGGICPDREAIFTVEAAIAKAEGRT